MKIHDRALVNLTLYIYRHLPLHGSKSKVPISFSSQRPHGMIATAWSAKVVHCLFSLNLESGHQLDSHHRDGCFGSSDSMKFRRQKKPVKKAWRSMVCQ